MLLPCKVPLLERLVVDVNLVCLLLLDLITLFDLIKFSIDFHDFGDVLKARKTPKQVPKTCVFPRILKYTTWQAFTCGCFRFLSLGATGPFQKEQARFGDQTNGTETSVR